MKVVFWVFCIIGLFFAAFYPLAFFMPMTYLRFHSEVGIGPLSLSWVIDMARQDLEKAPKLFCEKPYLLAWNGSFGQFPLVPEGAVLPTNNEYKELVLGHGDRVSSHVRATLDAMLDFNSKLIALCA